MLRRIAPIIFGFALLCFFIPWESFSAFGVNLVTLNGIQLVAGTTIKGPSMFGMQDVEKIPCNPFVLLTFIATIMGLCLNFLNNKIKEIGSAIISGIAIVLLFLFHNSLLKESMGILQVGTGFYLLGISFIAIIAIDIYLLILHTQPSNIYVRNRQSDKFCSQCGVKSSNDAMFCSECGHSLK